MSTAAPLAIVAGLLTSWSAPAAVASPQMHRVITLTGRVELVVANGGMLNDQEFMSLRSHGRHYSLRLPGDRTLPSGTLVAVTGTRSRGSFDATAVRVLAAAPTVTTTGAQSVYVIRLSWSGNSNDLTTGQVDTAMTNASNWFDEVSYHQMSLSLPVGQDAAAETISAPGDCSTGTGSTMDNVYDEAVAAAQARDSSFNPGNYDHVVIYFHMFATCPFAGLAEIGGSRVWINGELDNRVLTHEIGHNLGLSHAHSQVCTSGASTVTVSSTCDAPNEYGDPSDTMGSEGTGTAGHYNAAQKTKLGWLGSADTVPCGTATLQPYEVSPTSGTVDASIDAGADPTTHVPMTYWLEWRHPSASTVDSGLGTGLTDGVLLHRTDAVPGGTPSQANVGPDLLDGQPNTASDFSDAAIPSGSSVTTPEGYTFDVTSLGSTAVVTLSTTKPSPPRQLSATASGSTAAKLSWSMPGCLAGAGSIDHYTVSTVGGGSADTTSTQATVSGLTADSENEFLVSATANSVTGPPAVAPMSAPAITSWDYYLNGFGLHFTRSVSDGGQQIAYYEAHAVPVGGGAELTSFYDDTSGDPTVVPIATDPASPPQAGTKWNMWITPVMADFSEGPPSAHVTLAIADNVPPTASITAPTKTWTLGTNTTVKWSGKDTGGAGVASYDVRYRKAAYSGGFGNYVYPAAWQGTTATSASMSLTAGTTYCWSVRARDKNKNLGGWSAERCSAVPVDDRSMTASSGWSRGTGTSYFLHTITSSSHQGAKLTRTGVHAHHLVLVVTTCSGCGTVAVYSGNTKLGSWSLASSSTHNEVTIAVSSAALSGVTISVKVTSSGKPVKIDAIGVSAK